MTDAPTEAPPERKRDKKRFRPSAGTFIMAVTIIVIGSYLIVPMIILLIMSFNTAPNVFVPPSEWGIDNWLTAWDSPLILTSLWNSISVWFWVAAISLPIALAISLLLARTNMPFSRGLELMFWIAIIFPPLSATFGWIFLLTPDWGFLNVAIEWLPFVEKSPFNIYSFPGIVFTRLMADGIAFYVVLLTPAFRNMDGALEEASRVSGLSNLRTMIKVTLPMMIAPIVLVIGLQLVQMFKGFEVEYIIGSRFGYFVYSTLIYQLVRLEATPQFQDAIVLASITLVLVALIIPVQSWIVHRRQYTTIGSSYRPGVLDLGRWRWAAFGGTSTIVGMLVVVPVFVVGVGSFMTRVGFFGLPKTWTLNHWSFVLTDDRFISAFKTTAILATSAALVSPILFSVLAYLIMRTRYRGRGVLDTIIWSSAALPGILSGLGLLVFFLVTPGLRQLFGTIWPLVIVVIIAGKTTGTNVFKGVLVQLGAALEEAGRVSGAGWFRTYFRVVIPVLMPTMVLIGMLNFVGAANTTAAIILLASRETTTLSILALEFGSGNIGKVEEAGIISLIILMMTLGLALPMRAFARKIGVKNDMHV